MIAATAADYRELARRRLPRQLFDYVDGGAYDEATMRANVVDLKDVLLRPRAAQAAGVPFVESTLSICTTQEVADSTSAAPWFQLYLMRDRGYAVELMARASAAGVRVLVLTVDLAITGRRNRDTRNALTGEPGWWGRGWRGVDLAAHPRWLARMAAEGRPFTFGNLAQAVPDARTPAAFMSWIAGQFDPSVTWDDIEWLRGHWPGPIVVKGVLEPENAGHAVDAGVDGIIVSNHGGRQLDSVPSTARALPGVVDAVAGRVDVFADGAVRTGLDVAKMLSLGHTSVDQFGGAAHDRADAAPTAP